MGIVESTFGPAVRVGLNGGHSLAHIENIAEEAVEYAVAFMTKTEAEDGMEALQSILGGLAVASESITLHMLLSRRLGLSTSSEAHHCMAVAEALRAALFEEYDTRFGHYIKENYMHRPRR